MTAADPTDQVFALERPRLLGLAYRVLGSLVDAEDVVQEAWLRWAAADRDAVDRPAAWLTTVTTRLALDRLRAARRRREAYVGPWLPEPVLTAPGPEEAAEAAETLTLGFLAMLEQLDPVARVVFLLADVFGYPSVEIAATVGKSPAACRQIASRARKKLRYPSSPQPKGNRSVVDRLIAAVGAGDSATAVALMSEDVVLVTDGGAARHAARRPVIGPRRVSRFLVNVAKRLPANVRLEPALVNSAPGFVLRDPEGGQDAAFAFEVTGGLVSAIWAVINPDKLAHIDSPVLLS